MNNTQQKFQWVSDMIGNDFITKWKNGDYVLISSPTGTGKSSFIIDKIVDYYGSVLFIVNRTNLKRQIKSSLLHKKGLPVPETMEALDETTIIDNVVVTSYHAINQSGLSEDYKLGACDLEQYDIIIADEAHFIYADSSFNNLTRIAYRELIQKTYPASIVVFISATLDEIDDALMHKIMSANESYRPTLHRYRSNFDYSYLDVQYFKALADIVTTIKNDTSADKWLIFVTNMDDGHRLQKELGDAAASFIRSGTSDPELQSIIENQMFNKKVLIATKTLDNGVSIHDDNLKHIVIMAWDKTTFIQELGRKRINHAIGERVKLYIPVRYKKSFFSKLHQYRHKQRIILRYKSNYTRFCKEYDNRFGELPRDLFYLDESTRQWKINHIGERKLIRDIGFADYMLKRFKEHKKTAFVKEQLRWLGLLHTFNKFNLIADVIPNETVKSLTDYISAIEDKKLFADEQNKLVQLVLGELIFQRVDYRTKKIKPSTLEKILRDDLGLDYQVENKRERSEKSPNFGKTFWRIWKEE